MPNFVSAWTEGNVVNLAQREGDIVKIRKAPASWAFFATGLTDVDREDISRDPRIKGVSVSGIYTRVECRDRWKRQEIVEIIERASRFSTDEVKILEADVSPIRRLISDNPNVGVDPNPKLLFLDLEIDSRQTFEDMRTGHARLLSWVTEDQEGNVQQGLLTADNDRAEKELWTGLFDVMLSYDCLIAWAGQFPGSGGTLDFLVIQNRMTNLGIQYKGRDIPWHRWTWLDQLEVFKKYNFSSDDGGEAKMSYKLGHVANYLLGEGKDDFDSSKTWEAWEAGGAERQRLLKYNAKDTHLLRRIEEKTGFISLHLAVCHICKVFPDTESLQATTQGDGFMLGLGSEYGYRFASKPKFDPNRQFVKFEGAYVMTPTRLGVVDNVHVCDFAGLYPSIMRTFNMSPDTKFPDESTALKAIQRGEKVFKLPGRPTYFKADIDGMFRIALDRLTAKRAEYSSEMKKHNPGTELHAHYKRLSGAFKIVANSFYGITGSVFSRFYDPEISEGTTQTGKWLLEQVIDHAKAKGFDPFYGDTDSAFVTGTTVEEFRQFVKGMNAIWGDLLSQFGIEKHHIDLDFEKTFKRLVMVSAKRYAGSYAMYKGKPAENGAREIKGLEFKRGDVIRMAREFQNEVVDLILADGPLVKPSKLSKVVSDWRDKTINGVVDIEDFKITQSMTKGVSEYAQSVNKDGTLSKKPAHVRVAEIMIERGEMLGEGSKVSYLMKRGVSEPVPVPFEGVTIDEVDRIFYWENKAFPPTQRILELVYPQTTWKESSQAKLFRRREAGGQMRMDFPTQAVDITRGGKMRTRKRKRREVVILLETQAAKDCDTEFEALRLTALKAALEAHPGDLPVVLKVQWVEASGKTVEVTTEDLKGFSVSLTREAIDSINRVVEPGKLILPSDNPN